MLYTIKENNMNNKVVIITDETNTFDFPETESVAFESNNNT